MNHYTSPTEIRTATLAQQAAHLEFIRDPGRTARGFRNGLVISLAMWAGIAFLASMMWAAFASAEAKFATADLRSQETRLAYAGGRP